MKHLTTIGAESSFPVQQAAYFLESNTTRARLTNLSGQHRLLPEQFQVR